MSKLQDRNDAKRGRLKFAFDDVLRDLALLHDYEETIQWCIENNIVVRFDKRIKVCKDSGHDLILIGEGSNLLAAVENAQEAARGGDA
jgi:hypothetical protein